MTKKNFLLIAGIGALLLIILNWEKLMAFAKAKAPAITPGNQTTPPAPVPVTRPVSVQSGDITSPNQTLYVGATGPSVRKLQEMIISGWGAGMLPRYGADGQFGAETEAAVKAITGQSSTNLYKFQVHYYNPKMAAGGAGSNAGTLTYAPGAGVSPAAVPTTFWNPTTWWLTRQLVEATS